MSGSKKKRTLFFWESVRLNLFWGDEKESKIKFDYKLNFCCLPYTNNPLCVIFNFSFNILTLVASCPPVRIKLSVADNESRAQAKWPHSPPYFFRVEKLNNNTKFCIGGGTVIFFCSSACLTAKSLFSLF